MASLFYKHTPTILQMEAAECGAAALSIILAHYGRYISLEEARISCSVSRDGSSAFNIVQAAEKYGLKAQGVQVDNPEELMQLNFPMIIHWSFNHFIVLEKLTPTHAYINDPATGPRKIDYKTFDENFTGIALLFEKEKDFVKSGKKHNLFSMLKARIYGEHSGLYFVFIVSLFLIIPGIIIPGFSKIFIDDILIKEMHHWLWPLLIGLAFTGILRGLLTWLQQHYFVRLNLSISSQSSLETFWHVLHLPMSFFWQRYSGDIIERINANQRIADLISDQLGSQLVNLIAMVFFGIAMLLFDWQLALIGISIAFINALIYLVLAKKIENYSRKQLQDSAKLAGVEMYGIQSIETVKATAQENNFFNKILGQHAKVLTSRRAIIIYNQIFQIAPTVLTGFSNIAIIALGAVKIINGTLSVGSLVALQTLLVSFNQPLNALLNFGSQLQQIIGDLHRVDDVLTHRVDPHLIKTPKDKKKKEKLSGQLSVKDLYFGYSPLDEPYIQDINIELTPGKSIAIVGPTGSGKSSLSKLITGLYPARSGSVKYDGVKVEDIPREQLARSVSLVDQEIYLFPGTVKDNLTLWNNKTPASQLNTSLKDACILDEIEQRGGYQAIISEGGNNFSGGQQQRLEIARALTNNPTILVLDEATAHLDPVLESQIYENIKQRKCTLIIIAHRLSAIQDCDEIYVLDQGRVVEKGTHQSLWEANGFYTQLLKST